MSSASPLPSDATAARAQRVRRVLETMAKAGEEVTIAGLARRARVSRQFLYRHPELRAEALRQQAIRDEAVYAGLGRGDETTSASLRADLAHADEQNRRLRRALARLEARLSLALGVEVAAEAELGRVDETQTLRSRVAALEAEVANLAQAVHERNEELEACRARNRELVSQLNRGPAPPTTPHRS